MSHQFKKEKRPAKNKNDFFIQSYQKEKLAYVFNKILTTKPLLKMTTTSMKKKCFSLQKKKVIQKQKKKQINKKIEGQNKVRMDISHPKTLNKIIPSQKI